MTSNDDGFASRRWRTFSLRTLMIVMLVSGSFLGGWVTNELRHQYIIKDDARIQIIEGSQQRTIKSSKEGVEELSESLVEGSQIILRGSEEDVKALQDSLNSKLEHSRHQRNRSDSGTLRGRVVVVGHVPEQRKIEVTKGGSIFGQSIVDDSLIIDPESKGIANVVIRLHDVSLQNSQSNLRPTLEPTEIIAKGARFHPRVLLQTAGQQIRVRNSDPVAHNFRLTTSNNRGRNDLVAPGDEMLHEFPFTEPHPIRLVNGIYPWMQSWIVVTDHSCVALTDEHGAIEIRNVPVGTIRFSIWHERGDLRFIRIHDQVVSLEDGEFNLEIESGINDIGTITIDAKSFR